MSRRQAEISRLLIEHGANLEAKDANQKTPLHVACSSFSVLSVELVELLLASGANGPPALFPVEPSAPLDGIWPVCPRATSREMRSGAQ